MEGSIEISGGTYMYTLVYISFWLLKEGSSFLKKESRFSVNIFDKSLGEGLSLKGSGAMIIS